VKLPQKLNTIGPSEVFGEASLLLDKKRSVTARAGSIGVKTQLVPKTYIAQLQEGSPILSALLRNVQMRLVDSNEQSARYARDIEKLIQLAKEQNEVSRAVTDKLKAIQQRMETSFCSFANCISFSISLAYRALCSFESTSRI
jgi:CRP-like cAMP-binding protein